MQTYIPASSPVFVYEPCKACEISTGWSPSSGGSSVGWTTSATNASVSFNFTGTSIHLDLSFTPSSDVYTSNISINSTALPASAISNTTSITNLPLGRHLVRVDLEAVSSSSSASAVFLGVLGELGTVFSASGTNRTIDDTAWRDGSVLLTPGWNMLEGAPGGASNWINATEVAVQQPLLSNSYNYSLSWTDQPGASTTILFTGQSITAYGVAAPESGTFEVLLDGTSQGVYDAWYPFTIFGEVLYAAAGLREGNHTLELRNVDGRLSFDRAVVLGDLDLAPPANTTTTTTPTASTEPATGWRHTAPLSTGAIVGIALSATAAGLAILIYVIWGCRKHRKSRKAVQTITRPESPTRTTFWRWSARPAPDTFTIGTGFLRLDSPDPHSPPVSATAPGGTADREKEKAYDPHFRFPSPSSAQYPRPSPTLFIDSQPQPQPQPQPKNAVSFFKFSHSPGTTAKPLISDPLPLIPPAAAAAAAAAAAGGATQRQTLSPALSAAISGQTDSPLTQLQRAHSQKHQQKDDPERPDERGESFFPSMSKKSKKDKTSISSKITFALSDSSMSTSGILDGYQSTLVGAARHQETDGEKDAREDFMDLERSPPKHRFFGSGEGRPTSMDCAKNGGEGFF